MYGPPEDKEGECNNRMVMGDDYGDNSCTMRCQREPDHIGLHQEKYPDLDHDEITITWGNPVGSDK
jgi:hypothetical protein